MIYEVMVEEILQRVIEVEAGSIEEAVFIVEMDYTDEKIVLDSEDLYDVNIQPVHYTEEDTKQES